MSPDVVLVSGACGGVGTSTVAALVARTYARHGGRVVLLDLADGGAGLDVLLGLEARAGLRWRDLSEVRGAVDAAELSALLPRWEGVEVLSGGPGRAVADAVLPGLLGIGPGAGAGRVGHTLVIDLGLGLGALGLGAFGLGAPGPGAPGPGARGGDGLGLGEGSARLLVTGQDVRGVAAGLRALKGDAWDSGPVPHLVVRGRPRARLSPAEVTHALGLPLGAVVPHSSSLAESTERGLGPIPAPRSRVGRAMTRVVARVRTSDGAVGGTP